MLLGAHESTAGGLHLAFGRGISDGVEAVQIFTKSSRMWRAKEIAPADAELFRAEATKTGLGTGAAVHAAYLINLGAEAGDLREKSIAAFIDELQRCDALGVPSLVVHPGSHVDPRRGLRNIAEGLDRTFAAQQGGAKVLLETAAGQGSALGRTFEELREIRDQCKSPDRVAICLDTCHVFAAGYDLATEAGYDETFNQFDRVLGIELLHAFHLNDSKKPLHCLVDRHEHPGDGHIGQGCFARLVNDERFKQIPGFLEIPPEGNKTCLDRLKGLRSDQGNGNARLPQNTSKGKSRTRIARAPRHD